MMEQAHRIIPMPTPVTSDTTPQGFSLFHYLQNVKDAFETAFYTKDKKPVIKSVTFAPTSHYQADPAANNPQSNRLDLNIEPPAIVIDPYELKIDPSFDEYRQERDTPHTNTGNLGLYLFVKALVLVINNKSFYDHYLVQKLAFDIAGLVTHAEGFNSRVGLSQVTHVQEAHLETQNNRFVGWTVQWQHSVEIEPPDYSNENLRPGHYPKADANKINQLFIQTVDDQKKTLEQIKIEIDGTEAKDSQTTDTEKREA